MLYEVITNKGVAIEKVQQILGIDSSETMAFGDYLNVITSYSIHYTKLYDGETTRNHGPNPLWYLFGLRAAPNRIVGPCMGLTLVPRQKTFILTQPERMRDPGQGYVPCFAARF